MPRTQKHKNHLFLIRKKAGLEQKQVAVFLGHKTTNQISRYERGTKLPSLKTAFKLGIIYHLPVHVLFYGYHESCQREIKKQKKAPNEDGVNLTKLPSFDGTEFCTFAEKLNPFHVSKSDLDTVGSHITKLIKARGEKSGHFTIRK